MRHDRSGEAKMVCWGWKLASGVVSFLCDESRYEGSEWVGGSYRGRRSGSGEADHSRGRLAGCRISLQLMMEGVTVATYRAHNNKVPGKMVGSDLAYSPRTVQSHSVTESRLFMKSLCFKNYIHVHMRVLQMVLTLNHVCCFTSYWWFSANHL